MKKFFIIICLIAFTFVPVISFAQQYNQPIGPNAVGAPQGDVPTQQYSQPIGPNNIGAPQGNLPISNQIKDVNSLAEKLVNIGNLFTYLLIALAVIFIIWHVVIYMIKPGEGDRSEAAKSIGYGILGLFIILSIWGLVNILIGTFGTNNNVPTDRIPNANFLNK